MVFIEEWLQGCLGITKTPLAYVIRTDKQVPAIDPVGGYPNQVDEMIARAPIHDNAGNYTATYMADRTRV